MKYFLIVFSAAVLVSGGALAQTAPTPLSSQDSTNAGLKNPTLAQPAQV